jgi:ribonuclease HII
LVLGVDEAGDGAVAAPLWKPAKTFPPRSSEVEAISVHHLGPRRHEVIHELLLRVRARIDFG